MTKQSGFSLVEVLIAISIVVMAITAFIRFLPKRVSFNDHLQTLNNQIQNAYSESLLKHTNMKVRFYFGDNFELTSLGFQPLERKKEQTSLENKIDFPSGVYAKSFIIGSKNELALSNTKEVWLKVFKEGYTQNARLAVHFEGNTYNLTLSPFTALFTYD